MFLPRSSRSGASILHITLGLLVTLALASGCIDERRPSDIDRLPDAGHLDTGTDTSQPDDDDVLDEPDTHAPDTDTLDPDTGDPDSGDPDTGEPDDDTGPDTGGEEPPALPDEITTVGAQFEGRLLAQERAVVPLVASAGDRVVIHMRRIRDTAWAPYIAIHREGDSTALVYHNAQSNIDVHIPYRQDQLDQGWQFHSGGRHDLVLENRSQNDGWFDVTLECLAGPCTGEDPGTEPGDFEGLYEDELRAAIRRSNAGHTTLSYSEARHEFFSSIDNYDGQVECLYTGTLITTSGIPDHRIMNTEHTWPQSRGAGSGPANSDIHHLFPTLSDANNRRSNNYFGNVVSGITWSSNGSRLGQDASGQTRFEPRDVSKGNVARAMFYFAVTYQYSIPAHEETVLRQWHVLDPVDERERERNDRIAAVQHSRNPFIDYPELVDRISDF